jgi:hypothetical protein
MLAAAGPRVVVDSIIGSCDQDERASVLQYEKTISQAEATLEPDADQSGGENVWTPYFVMGNDNQGCGKW